MGRTYARTMFTEAAKEFQSLHGSRAQYERQAERGQIDEELGEMERWFIAQRDSFYLASVTSGGWPYVQHRGGPKGFLRVVDGRTLAFADFAGNKQYVTAGNLVGDDKVALFLMDYVEQARLKIIGHARVVALGSNPSLEAAVQVPGYQARVERVMTITIAAFDWNCSQHITPRYTAAEMAALQAG